MECVRISPIKILVLISLIINSPTFAASSCERVAVGLNKRFLFAGDCKDNPFYSCAGIMLHTLEKTSMMLAKVNGYQLSDKSCGKSSIVPWCPNEGGMNRGVVSFSFLHKDITATYGYPIFANSIGTTGYIFNSTTLTDYALCAYPVDAMTFSRTNCGCGPWGQPTCSDINLVTGSCGKAEVNGPTEFFKNYINNNHAWDIKKMCSFGPSTDQYQAFMAAAKMIINNSNNENNWNPFCKPDALDKCANWNEVVIKPWFTIPYKDIPIEAFFYVKDSNNLYPNSDNAKSIAKKLAKEFPGDVPAVGINIDKIYNESADGPFFCDL
jgi:hypothetical protein